MITASAATATIRTPPFGAAAVPGAATPAGRAEQVGEGPAQASGTDRITLTPDARLDLLMTGAGARLRDLNTLLLSTIGSVSDSAGLDTPNAARLVQAARDVATTVEAASDADAVAVGEGLPGQAERIAVLLAHASSSLQAATTRLMRMQATADSATAADQVAPLHNRDRASTAGTNRPVDDPRREPASWIAPELPDPRTISAALAVVQEIAMRLARLQTASPMSCASSAPRLSRQEGNAIRTATGNVRRPVLPGLVCVLVALVLLTRIDPGPVRYFATVLALPMVLAWCCHWLLRRRQNDTQRQIAWSQDGTASASLDVLMTTEATPGAGHATQAAPPV